MDKIGNERHALVNQHNLMTDSETYVGLEN